MSDTMIHDIERGLARDRAAVADTVAALRDRWRPGSLPTTALAAGGLALQRQAAPLASWLGGAVRARPVVATAAGLAVAAFVLRRRARRGAADGKTSALAGTTFEALSRWEDEGGPPPAEPVEPDEAWLDEALDTHARADALLARIDDAARRGLAPLADLARHRAEVIAARARETSAALANGLESLVGEARDTALQAREQVYLARLAFAGQARQAIEARPLTCGAAVAAGAAALGWLLPASETEDRVLAEARDRLAAELAAGLLAEALVSRLGLAGADPSRV